MSPAMAGGFLTTAPPGKPTVIAFDVSPLNQIQRVGLRYCFAGSVLPFLFCSELLGLGGRFIKCPQGIVITLIIDFLFTLASPSGNPNMCIFGLLGMSSTSRISLILLITFMHPLIFKSLLSNMLCFVSLLEFNYCVFNL